MNGEGAGVITTGGAEELVFGVVLCKHCQKMIRTGKGFDDRSGFCRLCDAFICAECVGKKCSPWQKQMEVLERSIRRKEARDMALKSYGVISDRSSGDGSIR